jgi:hypothetical protein
MHQFSLYDDRHVFLVVSVVDRLVEVDVLLLFVMYACAWKYRLVYVQLTFPSVMIFVNIS